MTEDLTAILRTIREVEDSLERRSARAGAFVMMTWGTVATSIFVFYGLVARDPEPFVARLGETGVQWAWVPPIVLGYLLNVLAQVRLGRMRAEQGSRNLRWLLGLMLVPIAILLTIQLTGFGWQLIPAMWVAFLGYTCLAWKTPDDGRRSRMIAYACFAAAALLALPPLWEWANFIAAGWYAIFLAGRGALLYYTN